MNFIDFLLRLSAPSEPSVASANTSDGKGLDRQAQP